MTRHADQNKRTEWIKRIARFEESGLSVAQFCRNERVSQACFYYWAKQVRKIDAGGRSLTRQHSSRPETFVLEPERQFIEVFVADSVRVRMPATNMATVAELIGLLTRSNLISKTASHNSRFQLLEITDRATQ